MHTFRNHIICGLALALAMTTNGFAAGPGDPAPVFTLKTVDGREVNLGELKGKVVYLDFWASWCAPCRLSLHFLNALSEVHEKDDLVVLAVNIDTERDKAGEALASLNPKYTVLLDPQGDVPQLYDLPKMPSSYVIGRDGKIRAVHSGFTSEDAEEINDVIDAALSEGP
jgi:peroxiredoxin